MKNHRWLCPVFIGLSIFIGFGFGVTLAKQAAMNAAPRYASTPWGCTAHGHGMVHNGWSISPKYKGGIESGGITGATAYECEELRSVK